MECFKNTDEKIVKYVSLLQKSMSLFRMKNKKLKDMVDSLGENLYIMARAWILKKVHFVSLFA